MAIYYADLVNGDDSNDGQTITTPKKTLDAATQLLSTTDDEVRVRGTDDYYVSIGNWTWTKDSANITATGDKTGDVSANETIYKANDQHKIGYYVYSVSYDSGSNTTIIVLKFKTGTYMFDSETVEVRKFNTSSSSAVSAGQSISVNGPTPTETEDWSSRETAVISGGWNSDYTDNSTGYTLFAGFPSIAIQNNSKYYYEYRRFAFAGDHSYAIDKPHHVQVKDCISHGLVYPIHNCNYTLISGFTASGQGHSEYLLYYGGHNAVVDCYLSNGNSGLATFSVGGTPYIENTHIYNCYNGLSSMDSSVIHSLYTYGLYYSIVGNKTYAKYLLAYNVSTPIKGGLGYYDNIVLSGTTENINTSGYYASYYRVTHVDSSVFNFRNNPFSILLNESGKRYHFDTLVNTDTAVTTSWYNDAASYGNISKETTMDAASWPKALILDYYSGTTRMAKKDGYIILNTDGSEITLGGAGGDNGYYEIYDYIFDKGSYKVTISAKGSKNGIIMYFNLSQGHAGYFNDTWQSHTITNSYADYEYTVDITDTEKLPSTLYIKFSYSYGKIYINKITIEKV